MASLTLPDINDALVGELGERGHWIVANLDTSICWPIAYQKHDFEGRTFYVVPLTNGHYPGVAVRSGTDSPVEARSAILRFLSAVSWVERAGAIVVSFTAGPLPRPLAREKSFGHAITADLYLSYLPEPTNERQSLALALMREGRGLNHPAYAFLSFYRVLEAAMPDGQVRKKWVADNLDSITDDRGREILQAMRQAGIDDVGTHLYRSGRMAIAHAKADPIINPDDASDHDRIASELPVMRGLAEVAIENVLGIKTPYTVHREHLYELAGFKEHLGEELVASILTEEEPAEDAQIDLPFIDVELRRREPYPPLKAMRPVHAAQNDRCLQLLYRSQDELVEMSFTLDFAAERLRFDWQKDIAGQDNGSLKAAEHAAALTRFIWEYVGNGELQIFDSETRTLLSRVGAFIPTNYWANGEVLLAEIDEWNAEAVRRRAADASSDL